MKTPLNTTTNSLYNNIIVLQHAMCFGP